MAEGSFGEFPKAFLLDIGEQKTPLNQWLEDNNDLVNQRITEQGAVLIRGLNFASNRFFSKFLKELFNTELAQYVYRSTPRIKLKGNIYTASEYPAEELIPQHNENSYANSWPHRIGFLCVIPAGKGGETPISNSQDVYAAIDKNIRDEFEKKQVLYVRNYGSIDLPWQEVFQTDNKTDVELYCKNNNLKISWIGDDQCRTEQVNDAVITHPTTAKKIWFNQAHLFHVSGLKTELKEHLLSFLDEQQLPRNAYFGDGTSIPAEYLEHIRDVYKKYTVAFKWQKNDVLLLDNLRYTHGRNSYQGDRKILVGMA